MSDHGRPVDRLSSYPYVVVRVGCDLCHRRGAYRLARLAATFGPEIEMDDLLRRLALDCRHAEGPHRRTGNQYVPKCHARFVDLGWPRPPPDLPPAMAGLKLIRGGKS